MKVEVRQNVLPIECRQQLCYCSSIHYQQQFNATTLWPPQHQNEFRREIEEAVKLLKYEYCCTMMDIKHFSMYALSANMTCTSHFQQHVLCGFIATLNV